ncbi:hypothetical protein [Sphingomonas sp. S-NIH.Pt15_0812]|uniref:hypothetical protein n=1 Tax=Sphingomonas sp. S-NIH.Pt15_0812 TaxID=1920129 RepID=UPI000F7DB05D|nr:hypothetical protein [Sphingomonas sp. S-NIH.Pt15_0812]RSU46328.1 hypothetical protein BRX43_15815 [Sphingomonas sp. S-NIH.Pt15_0812]
MRYDTKTMRELVDASPGETVGIEKADFRKLLEAVERGQGAEDDLAAMRRVILGAAPLGIAA